MQINVTYDASVTNAPAGFTGAVNNAVNFLDLLFSDPIVININVGWGEENGNQITNPNAIAQNEANWVIGGDYLQTVNLLTVDGTSPDDASAVANLPSNDPMGPGAFAVTQAQGKALGFTNQSGWNNTDGYVGLSSSVNWNFGPNNRNAAGSYDAIADFSIDGVTMLTAYNDPTAKNATGNPVGGDLVDWTPSLVGDSFGSGSWGTPNWITATDVREMNVIGYDLATQNVSTALQLYSLDSMVDSSGNYLGPSGSNALQLNVADSAANVSNSLDALRAPVTNGEIGSIALTDPSPVLSATDVQMTSDVSVFGAISGLYSMSIALSGSLLYVLPENVVNVTLSGSGVASLYGNSLNNQFLIQASGTHTVQTNPGYKTVTATAGYNTLDYSWEAGPVYVDLRAHKTYKDNVLWHFPNGNSTYVALDGVDNFSGIQKFIGGSGDNTFVSGGGDYTFIGGGGSNLLDYAWDSVGINVDLQTGLVFKGWVSDRTHTYYQGTDIVDDIQSFVGGAGANRFVSNYGSYTFFGKDAADTLDYSWDKDQITVDVANRTVTKVLTTPIHVLIALRQDDGRAALACRLNDVVADEPVAGFVCNELVVELMKLDSDIRVALLQGTKPSRANKNDVLERPRGGLLRRIDAMAHKRACLECGGPIANWRIGRRVREATKFCQPSCHWAEDRWLFYHPCFVTRLGGVSGGKETQGWRD